MYRTGKSSSPEINTKYGVKNGHLIALFRDHYETTKRIFAGVFQQRINLIFHFFTLVSVQIFKNQNSFFENSFHFLFKALNRGK
jgi:hypothetical protein